MPSRRSGRWPGPRRGRAGPGRSSLRSKRCPTGVVAHPARWDVGADPIQFLRQTDHAVELRWSRPPGGRSSLLRRDRLRILLAAAEARKGDLGGNLARHLAVLEQARAQGCELAVVPELSPT